MQKLVLCCLYRVHSRYTRMAGFGRREIEYMQALCIYNKCIIECYTVYHSLKCDQQIPGVKVQVYIFWPILSVTIICHWRTEWFTKTCMETFFRRRSQCGNYTSSILLPRILWLRINTFSNIKFLVKCKFFWSWNKI